MSTPENEHQEALNVLNNHYTILAKQMAAEIVEHREDFESPGLGSRADDIIEKHARHIQQLGSVYSILRWKAYRKKPEGKHRWESMISGVLDAAALFNLPRTHV